jgi:hypothetical protein
MNRLPRIYRLLTREFEHSRHLIWVDEQGRVVTDVTFFILLLLDAAEGMVQQDLTAWEKLVREALDRQLGGELLVAMDCYLKPYAQGLPDMPFIFFAPPQCRKAYAGVIRLLPLFDETDHLSLHGQSDIPEQRTDIITKRPRITQIDPLERLCVKDEYPEPHQTSRGQHWLFV